MSKVRCNNCMNVWSEDDLQKMFEDSEGNLSITKPVGSYDSVDACPNCKTDSFLMDMDEVSEIQDQIDKLSDEDKSKLSDGYHTFGNLYEHRHRLFIALMHAQEQMDFERYAWYARPWKSMQHSDGSVMPGWFVAGMKNGDGKMITYHLPIRLWDDLRVNALDFAPEWDGHSSKDVLERLQKF